MVKTWKILRNAAAILLVIAGIAGIFLPIVPQIPFLIAAFFVADFERKHVFMRWLLSRKRTRKLLGEKLTEKLLALDPARRKRKAAAAERAANPPADAGSPARAANLPASDREPTP